MAERLHQRPGDHLVRTRKEKEKRQIATGAEDREEKQKTSPAP
jgi:hypothetical protein